MLAFPQKRYGAPPRVRSYGTRPFTKPGLAWKLDAAHCDGSFRPGDATGTPPRRHAALYARLVILRLNSSSSRVCATFSPAFQLCRPCTCDRSECTPKLVSER